MIIENYFKLYICREGLTFHGDVVVELYWVVCCFIIAQTKQLPVCLVFNKTTNKHSAKASFIALGSHSKVKEWRYCAWNLQFNLCFAKNFIGNFFRGEGGYVVSNGLIEQWCWPFTAKLNKTSEFVSRPYPSGEDHTLGNFIAKWLAYARFDHQTRVWRLLLVAMLTTNCTPKS